ncbi:hypothetical protein AX016_2674 [Cellulophaga sp. RHA19]|uniref:hypothetical protein n=1 Tax=Cellulophaga sp. RHA19 TaxID=1798237 RepID=UPI000C2C2EB7|nr:hypothetical protein [Cellulophaga sp. RHA19]PKB44455.1 hypothetical protein AX016_2674 [Cellulophaga sp. RHA19]
MVILIILFIAIVLFFIFNWALKKSNRIALKYKKITAIGLSIVFAPLTYIFSIYCFVAIISYYPKHQFNQQKWNNNPEQRYELSTDIIESNMLIGKTRTEVIQLLGEDFYEYNPEHIAYILGFKPGIFSIDTDALDIIFKDNIVIKVKQHQT